ncbi:hypothetical protein [Nocardioides alcanivorans]|uniref:hypothetical protein n=1 Tax=Nocardioides alcanivorans TaxID=2897352 RepID=UPI001F3DE487|nr:hypothetical protein [Nocardioides alcanivorans]
MSDPTRPELATVYELDAGKLPTINGRIVPWLITADPAPMVEQLSDDLHVLWLPVLIHAPMPTPPEGRPDGDLVTNQEGSDD